MNLSTKQCSKCKKTKPTSEFYKRKVSKDTLQGKCKACNIQTKKDYNKTKRGHLSSYLTKAKDRAKEKNLPFDLDLNYLESITTDKCPVFRTIFDWGQDGKGHGPKRPSIDRVIPELGYVKGNVVFISHLANSIKSDVTEKELYKVADWLHEKRKEVLKNAFKK